MAENTQRWCVLGSTIRDSDSTLYPGFFYLPNLLSRLYISLGFFEKKALLDHSGNATIKSRARESPRVVRRRAREKQHLAALMACRNGTTRSLARRLCAFSARRSATAERFVSSTTMHNDVYRSATFPIDARKKGGRAEVDAERVDENDPTKTTRKTTTPLVRERRDEECKHRGEGGEGRNGCIKNDYYGLPRRKGAEDEDGVHTKRREKTPSRETYMLAHPVYDFGYIESIRPRHRQPQGARDYVSMFAVWSARKGFDAVTNYSHEKSMTKDEWLFRFIFLETVAGIPGMVAGMLRHMHSLRLLRHDNGWIHTLLEEAENERMHLMTFLNMKQPSILFRAGVLAQRGFF